MDMKLVEGMAHRVIADMGGSFVMALGYIGDRLGLFKALRGAGPISSSELAERTSLSERYVREWLRAMVAAEYLEYESASDRYLMTDEQAFVLADEESPMFVGGGFHFTTPSIYNVPRVMDAFRHGGGVPYKELGVDVPCAIERFFRPGYINFLTGHWLAAVDGLVQRLEAGTTVADVGCGRGQSTVTMARAFPKSTFVGVDFDRDSIGAARHLAAEAELKNVEFQAKPAHDLPTKAYGLVCSFDCIHDMVDPLGTLKAIRASMQDGADYVWSEPNASHNAHENRNLVGRVFHAISPLHCMTVSLAHGGAGLGTVIGEAGARQLAEQAGFSAFRRLDIDNPFNQFFALRK